MVSLDSYIFFSADGQPVTVKFDDEILLVDRRTTWPASVRPLNS